VLPGQEELLAAVSQTEVAVGSLHTPRTPQLHHLTGRYRQAQRPSDRPSAPPLASKSARGDASKPSRSSTPLKMCATMRLGSRRDKDDIAAAVRRV
jgi:hypothetical protein